MNWAAMSTIEHVYLIIACASSMVLAIQIILAVLGGMDLNIGDVHLGSDLGAHHDVGSHHDTGGHFQLITLRNVVAFFVLMGWSGLGFYNLQCPLILTIFLSCLCGFFMMLITAGLFYALSKFQADGTLNVTGAEGETGTIYLSVPPERKGIGKIQIVLQGRKVELNAVTDDKVKIESGDTVKIVKVLNEQVLVTKS